MALGKKEIMNILPVWIVYYIVNKSNVHFMRYCFLLLFAATVACSLPFLTSAIAQSSSSSTLSADGFISISNSKTANYQIKKAPVSVQQYCDFLNAVAINEDPHHCYNEAMKALIVYHPEGWFSSASYSVVFGTADLPITNVSLDDAMRYCNWTDFGQPTALDLGVSVQDVTEIGSYDFSNENGQEVVTINPQALFFLPNVDQLTAATSQISVSADDDFYEWTSTSAATAYGSANDEAADIDNLIFHSLPGEEPATMVCDPSAIHASPGFRLLVREEVAVSKKLRTPSASSGAASSAPSKLLEQDQISTVQSIIKFTVLGILTLASLPVIVMLGTVIILDFVGIAAIGTEVLAGVELDMGIVSMIDRVTRGYMSKFVELLSGGRRSLSGSASSSSGIPAVSF